MRVRVCVFVVCAFVNPHTLEMCACGCLCLRLYVCMYANTKAINACVSALLRSVNTTGLLGSVKYFTAALSFNVCACVRLCVCMCAAYQSNQCLCVGTIEVGQYHRLVGVSNVFHHRAHRHLSVKKLLNKQ